MQPPRLWLQSCNKKKLFFVKNMKARAFNSLATFGSLNVFKGMNSRSVYDNLYIPNVDNTEISVILGIES